MRPEFVASRPVGGPYFDQNMSTLASYGISTLDELESVRSLSASQGEAILRLQLSLACQTQNMGNITFGRYCIQNMPRAWVLNNIERLAEPLLATNDEWEYRRLLELYSTLDDGLTKSLAARAKLHDDPEIQEAGYDFTSLFRAAR